MPRLAEAQFDGLCLPTGWELGRQGSQLGVGAGRGHMAPPDFPIDHRAKHCSCQPPAEPSTIPHVCI